MEVRVIKVSIVVEYVVDFCQQSMEEDEEVTVT